MTLEADQFVAHKIIKWDYAVNDLVTIFTPDYPGSLEKEGDLPPNVETSKEDLLAFANETSVVVGGSRSTTLPEESEMWGVSLWEQTNKGGLDFENRHTFLSLIITSATPPPPDCTHQFTRREYHIYPSGVGVLQVVNYRRRVTSENKVANEEQLTSERYLTWLDIKGMQRIRDLLT